MSKKITNKIWLDRRSRKLQNSKYHRLKKRNSYSVSSNRLHSDQNTNEYHLTSHVSYKEVPKNFSFIENPIDTIEFFTDIVDEIKQKIHKNTFFIDSSSVEYVTIDALIYLIAIMQNIQINYDMLYTFRGNLPLNKAVAYEYKNSGFMSYVNSKIKKLPESTENMRIVSSNVNDPTITKELCQFIIKKLNKERRDVLAVQKVLIELMSNVYHHAYNNDDIMKNHWYLYAEHVDNSVRCIFLDTGAGIARTVRKTILEEMQRLIKLNATDADLIFSALQGDFRTRTHETHRGNGLSGVRELVETDLFKNFTVLSGSGCCCLNSKNEIIKQDYKNKIYGTIYLFDIV